MKCLNCGKDTTNFKYCSLSCAVSKNNQLKPKRKYTKKCKYCEKLIPANCIYCSQTCQRAMEKSIRSNKTCLLHGIEFIVERKRYNSKPSTRLICTKCNVLATQNSRKEIKKRAIVYLGGKCVDCGYKKCITALEFHHIDPTTKKFTIAASYFTWDIMQKELDKCKLLCANCHREKHELIKNALVA